MKTKPVLPLSEYRKLSDEEVVHRYVHRHEAQAMSVLFERYAHLLLGICFNVMKDPKRATVATQQIFTGMLDDLKRSEITQFKSWLIPYAVSHCSKLSGANARAGLDVSIFPAIDDSLLPEREFLLLKLDASLSLLTEQQGKCLKLFYLQRSAFRTISRQTGMSLQDVKKHVRSGRNRLLSMLHLSNTANPHLQ